MKEFLYVPAIGQLYFEHILLETSYPILFTCQDDDYTIYLCQRCQNNCDEIKWLITKTTPDDMIKVLKNKMTLRDAFLQYNDVQISVLFENGKYSFEEHNSDWNIDSKYLNNVNIFINAGDNEFEYEIMYYTNFEKYKRVKDERDIYVDTLCTSYSKEYLEESYYNVHYSLPDLEPNDLLKKYGRTTLKEAIKHYNDDKYTETRRQLIEEAKNGVYEITITADNFSRCMNKKEMELYIKEILKVYGVKITEITVKEK